MLLGTGSAATGVAELLLPAFCLAGLSEAEAKKRILFVDRQGLVTTNRETFKPRIRSFAQAHTPASFVEAIATLKPDVLIGATGTAGAFTEAAIREMARHQQRPVIIALSNPTSHTECTAEQAYQWSDGRAIFASGSPFAPVTLGEQTFYPAQGNNAYIFPGIGLGMLASQAQRVTRTMFLTAAKTLADNVLPVEIERGAIYPDLTRVRAVSQAIAVSLCETAQAENLTDETLPKDLQTHVKNKMFEPGY